MDYLLKQLEELLPEELTSSKLFSEVWKNFSKAVYQNDNILRFDVCEDYYDKLSALGLITSIVGKTSHEDNMFYFMAMTSNGAITFRIINDNGKYSIRSTVLTDDVENTVDIIIDENDRAKVENFLKKGGNENLTDYSYEAYYYENSVLVRKASEEEKDLEFASEFGVSLKEARKLRNDFQANRQFLNRNKTKDFLDSIENFEHKFNFCTPFILEDLEWFIADETNKETAIAFDEYYESDKDSFKPTGKLDDVKTLFLNVLGADGELVISKALFDSLQFYYMELTNQIVYGNGNIIRKLNGEYTLYTLKIEDSQLVVIPQTLTHDDLQKIYDDCSLNEEVPGLAEFFGITRGR